MGVPLPERIRQQMVLERTARARAVRPKRHRDKLAWFLPERTFEVVEFGAGKPEDLTRRAKAHPNRIYVAVDSAYSEQRNPAEIKKLYDAGLETYDNIKRPKNTNILTSASTMERFIDNMLLQGIRTRNIHLRMPDPDYVENPRLMDIQFLFENAKSLLVPNGKILITCNTEKLVKQVLQLASENKLSARKPRKLTTVSAVAAQWAKSRPNPRKALVARSVHEQRQIARGEPVFLIEITYGLKQAFQKKEDRKKWRLN